MRTRRRRLSPPANANELLAALRAGRLLSEKQLRSLAIDWSESRPGEPDDPLEGTRCRACELTSAGLLTAWQVGKVLTGEARRLRIGPYRLLEQLGAGGMGAVYKAEHRLMNRIVAVKSLRDATAVGCSQREVKAAACLSHPNIVGAYDAFRTRARWFLVMEYVEGIDLGRLLVQAGPLPVPLACETMRQAALALHCAHQHGLLHCDVKPSNLMLVHPPKPCWNARELDELTDGRRPVFVKLLDMGLAQRIDEQDDSVDKNPGGTPDYLAPERGCGDSIDGRSDLYSLGCAFYHLLTGQLPFAGGDLAGKLLRHRLDAPPPVRELRPNLPAPVVAVVERLMARDPADRYTTAADAAAALEACAVRCSLREQRDDMPTGKASDSQPEPLPSGSLAERTTYHDTRSNRFSSALAVALAASTLLLGATLWWARWPQGKNVIGSIPPQSLPFVVEGRPDGFASLAEAIAAADDGAVVTIHGSRSYPTPPLTWRGRSLTLRAAADSRPCLEMTGAISDPWQSLFTTDGDLSLTGLDLRSPANPTSGSTAGRLICCERAALRLTDCNLSAPCGAGVVHRNGGVLSLQGCRVETGGTALSVEVGGQKTCTVRIVNTILDVKERGGAALALWAPAVRQPTTVDVEMQGDTVTAGRATALTALPAKLHITAQDDAFFFRDALLSCAGYADRDAWKRGVTWEGHGNLYHGPAAWVTLDGAPAGMNGLGAWCDLWHENETGSREETDGPPSAPDKSGLLQGIVSRNALRTGMGTPGER